MGIVPRREDNCCGTKSQVSAAVFVAMWTKLGGKLDNDVVVGFSGPISCLLKRSHMLF